MATGASGVDGALVQRRAKRDTNQEHVNVIHQLPNTVGRNAMDRQVKSKFVTGTFPAQVSYDCHRVL